MNKQVEDIKAIREMMEKSSKFQSISGISLVLAGLIAVAGAAFAYFFLRYYNFDFVSGEYTPQRTTLILLADALVVLALAVGVISFMSWRKAKKNHQSLFNQVTLRAAYNLLIPLATGGIFSLVLLYNGQIGFIAASTLIFYGLALINASKFTVGELHWLGLAEVLCGLLAAIYLYHGIYWWTLGFGVLHIIFGWVMYFNEKNKK